MQIVFAAFPLSTQLSGVKAKMAWSWREEATLKLLMMMSALC
jgi:hypothetical protein